MQKTEVNSRQCEKGGSSYLHFDSVYLLIYLISSVFVIIIFIAIYQNNVVVNIKVIKKVTKKFLKFDSSAQKWLLFFQFHE